MFWLQKKKIYKENSIRDIYSELHHYCIQIFTSENSHLSLLFGECPIMYKIRLYLYTCVYIQRDGSTVDEQ